MSTVEIIAIGNEILKGDVLDINTNWLCKNFTGLGGRVNRAVVVRDELEVIAAEIRAAMKRQPDIIVTTGGLGPTSDDLTLEAVGNAANRPLELNSAALELVKQKYKELAEKGFVEHPDITPTRRKMAMLPKGGEPLKNNVGGAPGVLLSLEQTTIINLPGVPPELQDIFEGALQPVLKKIFGEGVFLEKMVLVNSGDESVLAPILDRVSTSNPGVYVKSRAKRFGPDVKLRVTLSASGSSREEVEHRIEQTLDDLRTQLEKSGISLDSVED